MALFSYLIAFGHFTSELFIFRTTAVNVAVLSPMIVASKSIPRVLCSSHSYSFHKSHVDDLDVQAV